MTPEQPADTDVQAHLDLHAPPPRHPLHDHGRPAGRRGIPTHRPITDVLETL